MFRKCVLRILIIVLFICVAISQSLSAIEFKWDAFNRLVETNGIKYLYDARSRRVAKVDAQTGDILRVYIYHGWQMIAVYDGNQNLLFEFVHGPHYIDEHLCLINYKDNPEGDKFFYIQNPNNYNVEKIVDETGNVVETYEYTAYGETTVKDANGVEIEWSQVGNPYGFHGRFYDTESHLYYFRYRMYMPEMKRFISMDPLGFVDSMNLYETFACDPVNVIDPYGLWEWDKDWVETFLRLINPVDWTEKGRAVKWGAVKGTGQTIVNAAKGAGKAVIEPGLWVWDISQATWIHITDPSLAEYFAPKSAIWSGYQYNVQVKGEKPWKAWTKSTATSVAFPAITIVSIESGHPEVLGYILTGGAAGTSTYGTYQYVTGQIGEEQLAETGGVSILMLAGGRYFTKNAPQIRTSMMQLRNLQRTDFYVTPGGIAIPKSEFASVASAFRGFPALQAEEIALGRFFGGKSIADRPWYFPLGEQSSSFITNRMKYSLGLWNTMEKGRIVINPAGSEYLIGPARAQIPWTGGGKQVFVLQKTMLVIQEPEIPASVIIKTKP